MNNKNITNHFSLFLPRDTDIKKEIELLKEFADKQTDKVNKLVVLEVIVRHLQTMNKKLEENGLVIYAGVRNKEVITFVTQPHNPIITRLCSFNKQFVKVS